MLAKDKEKQLLDLTKGCNKDELIWISGYLQGLLGIKEYSARIPFQTLGIVYITDKGNSKKLATEIFESLKGSSAQVTLKSAEDYTQEDLARERHLLVVVSTTGEGEVPESGNKLVEILRDLKPNLSKLSYAIIALGDSSYTKFCAAGEQIEAYLKGLGADPFLPIRKVDGPIDFVSESWLNALSKIKKIEGIGKILKNKLMGTQDSGKAFHHIEIDLDLDYQPGDVLKYIPQNSADQVNQVLEELSVNKDEIVDYRGEPVPVLQLLKEKLSINRLTKTSIKKYLKTLGVETTDQHLETLVGTSILKLMELHPIKGSLHAADLARILNPISARYYSIASCPLAHKNQIHLTVSEHVFELQGEALQGFASNQLAILKEGDEKKFSIYPNDRFRLPAEDRDMIMIGPGTGIAPFRSFLYHRQSIQSKGKNWLFFGGQHVKKDFLYENELKDFQESGHLFRLDAAFSRDQEEKVYVQDLIKQQAKIFMEWLDSGAYLYICGNKSPMSEDVEQTIIEVISLHKKLNQAQSEDYLMRMKKESRYFKDVY